MIKSGGSITKKVLLYNEFNLYKKCTHRFKDDNRERGGGGIEATNSLSDYSNEPNSI